MQDCIVECLESPIQLEEIDLRLEKKIDVLWWSKVTETDEWYKLQYEDQDYVWTLKTLTWET